MGYLDSTKVTVDAVLTKRGRELMADPNANFSIVKFALGDDEIDYRMYDFNHANGSNYYGEAIENLPLLEAFTDERATMVYKLTTLPKNTVQIPGIINISQNMTKASDDPSFVVSPGTRNGTDSSYSLTVTDTRAVTISPNGASAAAGPIVGYQQTCIGESFTLTPQLNTISDRSLALIITGNDSGASYIANLFITAV
jgi:hypothetical protein